MKHLTALTALFTLVVLTGCASLQEAMNLQKIDANLKSVQVDKLSLDAADLLFDIEVENPYSVPIPLVNLDYALTSQGKNFANGKADLSGTVPAMGSKTVSVPARVTYTDMLAILSQVKPGSILPYSAELGLSLDNPLGESLRLPLKRDSELPIPAVPKVEIDSIDWSDLSIQNAAGVVKLKTTNPNAFPLDLSKLDYVLALGNQKVASAEVAKSIKLAADGGSDTIEIPISFSPVKMGLGFFNVLTGSGSGYEFDGNFDVTTPYGPLSLPVSETGRTMFKK